MNEQKEQREPAKRLLRILVVAELLMIVLSVAVALLTEPSLPEPLREWVQAQEEVDLTPMYLVLAGFGFLMVVALLVSNIGLFFFLPAVCPAALSRDDARLGVAPSRFGSRRQLGLGRDARGSRPPPLRSHHRADLRSPLRELFERPASPSS